MENGEVVNEAPAPSVEEQMLNHLENSENEESQSSDPDGETIEELGSDSEKVEAQDGREEEADTEEELIPKSSFMKRMNSLQASRRKAESRATGLEEKMAQYDVLLTEMKDRLDTAETKLVDYDEHDPRDAEIRALKLRSKLGEMQRKQQVESQQREFHQQQQEVIDSRADDIISTARKLSDKFSTFSAEELVISFSKTDDTTMEDLAKRIHSSRLDHYKKHLSKGRGIPKAPAPLRTQGARSLTQGHSADEMVKFLESISGDS
jgi:hypothetical protein